MAVLLYGQQTVMLASQRSQHPMIQIHAKEWIKYYGGDQTGKLRKLKLLTGYVTESSTEICACRDSLIITGSFQFIY
jgi:hypothetical protein